MTRHGKNCTAGAVYTYHEKRKDTGGHRGGRPCSKCSKMWVNGGKM
uniref:Nitric oxide synthase-interacting protein zinc-finger domain-containing protein n=1 Tax=Anser cygnoides TaxID=8845 RepID=A0A8B9DX82_ANSCY